MAANTSPISPITPTASAFNTVHQLTANTAMDGTGTVNLIMTAGANGSRVNRLVVQHLGTNVATVMRIFLNNGATNTVATNNSLIAEATIASNTVSQVAASIPTNIALNMVVPPNYKLYYTIGTTVASGHAVTAVDSGDY